jgi:uncharacterized delta-60 repeat protein
VRVSFASAGAMLVLSLAVAAAGATGAPAGPTGLDASFGGDGRVLTDLTGADDFAYAVAIQTDGKIVAAGVSGLGGGNARFTLVRYRRDGKLNASFGDDGVVRTNLTGTDDIIHGVAIQPDGRIVVAGVSGSGGPNAKFALARYLAGGSLDPSFGGDGTITTDLSPGPDEACCLAIQADGKILVAEVEATSPSPVLALVRYDVDGTLDTSFGGDGIVEGSYNGLGTALALQSDGKILVANPLVRYEPDGTLDPTFATPAYSPYEALAIQTDGKIVGGWTSDDCYPGGCDYSFALNRYRPDGAPDTTFGTNGEVIGTYGDLTDLAIRGDGGIVAAGFGGGRFALQRFDADGTRIESHYIDFRSGAEWALAEAIQPDGNVVLAGVAHTDRGDERFALLRYVP